MTTYVALLRAVNVGGTGKLAMRDLVATCGAIGFKEARTYIQSGNVVFRSHLSVEGAQASLEEALANVVGARVDVLIRQALEMREILAANPFPAEPPSRVAVLFLSAPVPRGTPNALAGPDGEQVVVGVRELYIFYPGGMGRSKLKLPKLPGVATARNINTVTTLVRMSGS